jgi:cystine transport system substrate-binding protein
LKAQNVALESQERSALLSLYSLDSQLEGARARLVQLQHRAATLRRERVVLAAEMKFALSGARVTQQHLASRVRLLFDRGETSPLEIIFGAKSLDEALGELDNLEHVTSINNEVLAQLRSAKARIDHTSRALSSREAKLAAATRAQEETTRSLAATRAERSAYVDRLRHQRELNSLQIARIESQAAAAGVRTQQLAARVETTAAPAIGPAPTSASTPVATTTVTVTANGRTLAVSAVAYSLPGHTASGLPVGYGIVAVDPSVIPLGTHMTVPGYGSAVAADTGSAIRGAIIDLWFPTVAQARAWGRRSVTITLD